MRFRSDAVVPSDSPMDAARFWRTYYTVSEDGGRTNIIDEILQQKGDEFSPEHPLPNVWHGKNGNTQGALSCAPRTLDESTFLLPLEGTMVDDEGKEQQVIYSQPMPPDFTRSEKVVVIGSYHGDVFNASKIILKCPSKYQEENINA